ncbi:nitrite reductase large subunit NirB [Pontiellaceae bacterium B1224]|nr:nitrite reductase large subunit NirB [Pontiellaceae bacterium B1224]
MSLKKHEVVVVGNGMVSVRFCQRLLEYDKNKRFHIKVLGEECRPAYDRVQLTSFYEKESADELILEPASWYEQNGIELFTGDRVVEIDRKHRTVSTQSGRQCAYDHLILATGSSPFVPPIKGKDLPGVFVYRTIEDLEAIREYAKTATTASVIGGGLLGLEAAKAVHDMGLQTTVVERSSRLLTRQVDTGGGVILKHLIEDLGVHVAIDKVTLHFTGEDKVDGIAFEGDNHLQTDMIIISAGIRPNDELAKECDIKVGPRGGIEIDSKTRTSDHHIHAIGECALYDGMIYGLVAPGYDMADAAAANLCHEKKLFEGADMSTKLKLMGVDVASAGEPLLPEEQTKAVVVYDSHRGIYKKLVLSLDGKKLLGAVLVGDASEYGLLSAICKKGMELPDEPETLLVKTGAHNDVVIEYDDDEIICSCKDVTAGAIRKVVQDGGTTFAAVKKETHCGTGCGGCAAVATDIFESEMTKMGVEIDTSLCEHFSYTRQELFNIVKVTGAKSFDEVIESHGKGAGCEICKPATASILASIQNDHVVNHAQIQDTNDKYMGNIQRNGTYSVVPRAPGGELTPDQLIVIGEVAKKYDLYTKVTGGQRIDLFGAHLNQLPDIWKELIAAGLETGHAYGKSLRTVKSCVGSSWCRFGLKDSVDMAVDLENRYKGLRSPHKLKMAVSGCVRECAEAQSKDVGLIATEDGWNIYVCGNGGVTPRHADLLATNVDDETAIKYIDRFLMYYVRTADRLMRTAPWMEKLEGGLKHLQDVVINDSLGLNDQLEADMQHVVDTYQCEWATTLNDPEKLKMFHHYSNSDETDQFEYIEVRGQKRPAPWKKEYEPLVPEPTENAETQWVCFGEASAIPKDGGETLKYGRHQIAVFNFAKTDQWFASQNLCPHKREMVLSRGLLGDVDGLPKVVCPMHKRAFSLETGEGLSDPELSISTFPVEIREGRIFIDLPTEEELDKLHICNPDKVCS